MPDSDLRISFDIACMKALRKAPTKVFERFHDMVLKAMSDPSRNGLNFESVEGARDNAIRSIRIDQGYRAIGYLSGRDLLLLHVDEHDKAYRWATNKTVRFNASLNRLQILDLGIPEPPIALVAAASEAVAKPGVSSSVRLFDNVDDATFLQLGVSEPNLERIRSIGTEGELEALTDTFDPATYDILFSLAAGFAPADIPELVTPTTFPPPVQMSFETALRTDESRQQIFVPEGEDELRRFLNGELEGWRVFLHPEQRRIAYRDYAGPVLVRGGAGTGKTVVAMHRAKYMADRISKDASKRGQRVLFTTFTSTLAQDVRANLMTLCPEHLSGAEPRIEVINLDRWVGDFLRRRGFDRQIVYFDDDRRRVETIWQDTLATKSVPDGLSDEFVKDEWGQVVQAKGIGSSRDYLTVSRSGRGTPLDRRKRQALWSIFEAFSARMIDEGLTEPDTAYREAAALLRQDGSDLPYAGVVVDETQDMGEAALNLIRSIAFGSSQSQANSLFLVGDAHQRIYARKASMSACGIEVRGRSYRLKLNYRTTDLIRRWAVGVLEAIEVDDLDESTDSLRGYRSLVKGFRPELVPYSNRSEEIAGLIEWVRSVSGNAALGETAILCRTGASLDALEDALTKRGVEVLRLRNDTLDDSRKPGVRLATMHRAKGLEYAYVALALLSANELPPQQALQKAVDNAARREIIERERSLLHVAATRAKRGLRISWHGERPAILVS